MNLATGKWESIFSSLGIEVGNGHHCPCPVCGGKDRFRFDNQHGRGTYICNQCGAGDGLELVKHYFHCDAKEACQKVAECLSLAKDEDSHLGLQNSTELKSELSIADKVSYLLSKSTQEQSEYLTKKGLTLNLPLLDNGRIFAPMLNIDGCYVGGQFIEQDGNKHLMKGTKKNAAFMLVFPQGIEDFSTITTRAKEIIICEGLATGITIAEFRHDSIILSAVDAGNLIHVAKVMRKANDTARIIIAGDNDIGGGKNTGKDKAIEAAKVVNGYYSIPDTDFKSDWDDYRQQYGLQKTSGSFEENLIKPEADNLSKLDIENSNLLTNVKAKKDISVMNLSQMASSQRAELLSQHYDNNLALNIITDEIYHYNGSSWQVMSDKTLMRTLAELFHQAG